MNGISMVVSGVVIFIVGAVCGAKMVYRFRHVTTKVLHQGLLNTLRERTVRLDRLTQSAKDTEIVAIDLEEYAHFGAEVAAIPSESRATALRVYRET